ncbi:Hypothetical Protein FCC1311_051322 [Hondaea fermentalgiana]|uniref:UBA domain-containing protein n=1 Tax=Hondaea fermentalgiana TaxID=2315210 RepID=A0A2R5GKV7_9STRA|nr:Hypothetical Protein FCC1311_051322 [Hondaea fermentalgiana]|eukprot:GBG28911.1 Hypothetical Protein FCC1311_051322 [Hondaea fermentalgiana]
MMNALWKRLSGSEHGDLRVASASEQAKVDRLVQMGFEASPALSALRESDGNVDAAVAVLLAAPSSSSETERSSPAPPPAAPSAREVRAAAAEARQARHAARNPLNQIRTAMGRARSGSGRQEHNAPAARPTSPRSFETRLEVICGELANFPRAVDQLVYMIKTIIENPGVRKYREVKLTNRRFAATVGTAGNAGIDLLKLVGFVQTGDWLVLRGAEDPARLWLAKGALENTQNSSMYTMAQDRAAFMEAIEDSRNSANAEEAERRLEYVSSVPVEPEVGIAGTTRVRVYFGENVVERRFNADDVVKGIIMWLGAEHSSLIPRKLESGAWELVNATLYPPHVMELDTLYDKTLQSAGLWPGAELRVQAAGTLEAERREKERAAE